WAVAVQRFGQVSALSQFLLGATVGFGMSFWPAVLAFTLGSVILELITILVGVIGVREGLSTSMIARWTGFGRGGSALIGLAIGISLIGWFGIQSAVSAQGLVSLIGGLPEWGWSRSEEHTSELQSPCNLVCRLLLEKKKEIILHFLRVLDASEFDVVGRRRRRDVHGDVQDDRGNLETAYNCLSVSIHESLVPALAFPASIIHPTDVSCLAVSLL